mmetsp:Transcript_30797/g.92353  ORF Transcript_30797/g.92353 Transcript_30797/m.92353 type:complete len:248 (+) Transcript_30797:424-1167(+)
MCIRLVELNVNQVECAPPCRRRAPLGKQRGVAIVAMVLELGVPFWVCMQKREVEERGRWIQVRFWGDHRYEEASIFGRLGHLTDCSDPCYRKVIPRRRYRVVPLEIPVDPIKAWKAVGRNDVAVPPCKEGPPLGAGEGCVDVRRIPPADRQDVRRGEPSPGQLGCDTADTGEVESSLDLWITVNHHEIGCEPVDHVNARLGLGQDLVTAARGVYDSYNHGCSGGRRQPTGGRWRVCVHRSAWGHGHH